MPRGGGRAGDVASGWVYEDGDGAHANARGSDGIDRAVAGWRRNVFVFDFDARVSLRL